MGVRRGQRRIQLQRPIEVLDRARIIAPFGMDEAAFVESQSESRLETDCLFEVVNGPVKFATNAIGLAATNKAGGKSRIDGDRSIVIRHRLVVVTAKHVEVGALIERLDVPWIGGGRAVVVLERTVEIAPAPGRKRHDWQGRGNSVDPP